LVGWINKGSYWAERMIAVYLLWIVFTALGFGIFGAAPATVALCAIMRVWVLGECLEKPIIALFWWHYRREFIRSNALFWSVVPIGFLLAWDTSLAVVHMEPSVRWTTAPVVVADLSVASILLYLFPLYVHWHFRHWWMYYKASFLLAVANSWRTIALLLLVYTWVFVIRGVLPIVTAVLVMYAIMRFTVDGMERTSRKGGGALLS